MKKIIFILFILFFAIIVFAPSMHHNGDFSATNNITSENVFLPAYIRSASNSTILVKAVGNWTNITFSKKAEALKLNIGHTWNDATNTTFTINDAGVYHIDYTVSIRDSSANPDAHVGFQLVNGDGTRIKGSYSELDTSKQNAEIFMHNSFLAEFSAGQTFVGQFTSSDADVSVIPHGQYNPNPSSAQMSVVKVSNS